MAKISSKKYGLNYKIVWSAVGIFAVSGILPWFVVNFPIGNLKISIFDLFYYFIDSQRVEVDIYSTIIYEVLLGGWTFAMVFLIVTAVLHKRNLILISSILTIIPPIFWAFIVPQLRIQMIFLSLSNQPIAADQTLGSGEIASIVAGCVTLFAYLRARL